MVFVGFSVLLLLLMLFIIYEVVSSYITLIKWELSECKYKQQIEQGYKDNLKSLADRATQKETSQKQFQESIKKQIEENEKWNM